MGFLTGVTLFCWIVVFTFRKNLQMIARYSLPASHASDTSASPGSKCTSAPSAPPPAYSEIDTSHWNNKQSTSSSTSSTTAAPCGEPQDEAGPPGYEAVMRQQSESSQDQVVQGAVQRKKSLTNHNV